MGLGRWERQPNGDYQHFSEEELAERAYNNSISSAAFCLLLGPVLLYYNYDDIGVLFYIGCGCTLLGILALIVHTKDVLLAALSFLIIGGVLWGFYKYVISDDDKNESPKEKTEAVSDPQTTSSSLTSNYSSETIEKDAYMQYYEEMDAEDMMDTEETDNEVLTDEPTIIEERQDCTFPGGDQALKDYVYGHLNYPVVAEENGVQGNVRVQFDVMEDGSVENVIVLNSDDPSLDEEAKRLIREMPKWNPGTKNGQPVITTMQYDIEFKCNNY